MERRGALYKGYCCVLLFCSAVALCFCPFALNYYPDLPSGFVCYAFSSASSSATIVCESDLNAFLPVVGFKGKSVYVKKSDDGELKKLDFLLIEYGAKEVFRECVKTDDENISCVYYYTEKIPFYQIVPTDAACDRDGFTHAFFYKAVKVNIHVAVSESGVTVGCPFIYGGY